jgi:hypothetical protein
METLPLRLAQSRSIPIEQTWGPVAAMLSTFQWVKIPPVELAQLPP